MFEAYFSFDGVGAVIFGAICFTFVLLNALKNRYISFLGWSVLFFGMIYGISAPLIVDSIRTSPGSFVGSDFVLANSGSLSSHTIAAFLSVGGVIVGWGTASLKSRARRERVGPLFKGLNKPIIFNRVFWAMIIVSVIAQYLYAIDYGGLLGVIDYSRLVRSNIVGVFERSRFSFLSPLAGFSSLACFGFLGLILSRCRKFSVSLGFAVSLVFALYVLYTWQGRLGMVTFITIIFLAIVLVKQISPGIVVLSFIGVAIGGMYLVYTVSDIWDLKTSESFAQFYTKEISFVFTGFWAEVTESENTLRLFYDVAVLPLFLLPSSLTIGWFENVKNVHTATMLGAPKGEAGVTGAMPIDIITMGYLQMDFIGVFFYGLLFGVLLRVLQTMVDHIELPGIKAVFTAYIALKVSGFALFYAHPEQLVGGNFPILVTLILLFLMRRLRSLTPTSLRSQATVTNGNRFPPRANKEKK